MWCPPSCPFRYKCDKCNRLVPAIKQTTIHDDPNCLILHLKVRCGAVCGHAAVRPDVAAPAGYTYMVHMP